MRRRTGMGAAAALAAWGLALACAERAWDAGALVQRQPQLAGELGERLADTRPYALPAAAQLTLFLCRWPDGATIPVALPARASAQERRALEAALAALAQGLGLRFAPVADARAGIEIEILDDLLAYAANTVADCAVDPRGLAADPVLPARGLAADEVLPARLVHASVQLARGDPRLAGTALHELGHALGFQGHARRGPSVMHPDTDATRRAGERVLAGEPWDDPALRALYAVPSGTVLARLPLPAATTRPVDALLQLTARGELTGPLVRVGDREGQLVWLDAGGQLASVRVTGLAEAARHPERVAVEPSVRAAELLAGAP